jgi:hypothetical protein
MEILVDSLALGLNIFDVVGLSLIRHFAKWLGWASPCAVGNRPVP